MPSMTSDTSPPLAPGLFTAIDHVGVAVADLDEAIEFYASTYGMRLAHQEVNEEQGVREAMMAVGDSGSCIQLLAPLNDESTIAKFLDRSGPGIQQLAYRVTDLEAVWPPSASAACACCTTSRAAAPRTPGSTSSTPRTPVGSS